MKNTYFLALFFLFLSCSGISYGQTVSVYAEAGDELAQFGNEAQSGIFYNAFFISQSGGSPSKVGGSKATPVKVYIPIDIKASNPLDDTSKYILASKNLQGINQLPVINSSSSSATNDGLARLFLTLENTTGVTQYLHFAVNDPNDGEKFLLIQGAAFEALTANSSHSGQYSPNLTFICAVSTDLCTDLVDGAEQVEKLIVYAYLYTEDNDTDFDGESARPGGVFFELNMSNKISGLSDRIPSLTQLIKGDEQVVAVFEGDNITEFYRTLFINYPSAQSSQSPREALTGNGGELVSLENKGDSIDGRVAIKGLSNNVEVNMAVVYQDRYQFGTNISSSRAQTPELIDAYLLKNACFLISAGFLKDHYVLDYLRDFRDHQLARFALGQDFIELYYQTAPKYAVIISQNDFLRWVFRGVGHFLYYFLRFFPFIMVVLLILIATFLYFCFKKKVRGNMVTMVGENNIE